MIHLSIRFLFQNATQPWEILGNISCIRYHQQINLWDNIIVSIFLRGSGENAWTNDMTKWNNWVLSLSSDKIGSHMWFMQSKIYFCVYLIFMFLNFWAEAWCAAFCIWFFGLLSSFLWLLVETQCFSRCILRSSLGILCLSGHRNDSAWEIIFKSLTVD